MGKFSHHVAAGRVDAVKEVRKVSARIETQARARSLGQSSIGKDGLRIYDEGSLDIEGGGNLNVNDGGSVNVRDGGQVITRHPNTTPSTWAGSFVDDGQDGYGFLVQQSDATDIFAATSRPDGTSVRVGGNIATPVDQFIAWAGNITMGSRDTAGAVNIYSVSTITLGANNGVLIAPHATTGSAANCVIGVDGLIQRSTSSLRYKDDVRPLNIDPDVVLAMEPITFVDKTEAAAVGVESAPPRYVGFTAEQLHECGMGQWVNYDADGPESIQYDRLPAAQQVVLRQQRDRLVALETTVAEQGNLIAALSARLDALET